METTQAIVMEGEPNASDAEAYVTWLFQKAVQQRASDVHVQPHADGTRVLYRIDGVLREATRFESTNHERVISRLKVLACLPVYQHELPQEGRIEQTPGLCPARLAVFPTIHGEKAVVRLFHRLGERPLQLDELGFIPQIVKGLRQMTEGKSGCILLTGASGSGKTTTIYSLLRDIYCRRGDSVNVVTLEDPVEMNLEFAVQSEIKPAVGYTFATGLRSILRQDPEVLMLGEIRDRETAQMVVEAGLTGHLVISTIHSGNCVEVFTRLLEMGIEPYLVASSILGVLSQRLVRRKCPACLGKAVSPDGLPCEECQSTGFRGRTAVGEMLVVSDPFRKAVLRRLPTSELTEVSRENRIGSLLIQPDLSTSGTMEPSENLTPTLQQGVSHES
ncbi:MAG TPA: GspE/PulE family protein [bacterium]|nr:GspE/PulE family protein [bacterium]